MKHGIVYSSHGTYAGWPANHGAWRWGDEFLVGFLHGPYKRKSMHNIGEPFTLAQARSLDGGETWHAVQVEIPVDVIGQQTTRCDISNSIIRVRGSYDHGGDYVDAAGCFYASEDKGATWHGPHSFDGLEERFAKPMLNTSRTCVDGPLLFLSRADARMWGTDEVFVARHVGGGRFEYVADVANDKARAVMPSVARVQGRIVAACRRRITNRLDGWIEAFGSDDDGLTWRPLSTVGVTGTHNGNPPALIARGDQLVCIYAHRNAGQMMAHTSDDRGETWSPPIVLRSTNEADIGYPQLFKREDGELVAVYYWSSAEHPHQHIAYTRFA